jgi:transcriptional regulator
VRDARAVGHRGEHHAEADFVDQRFEQRAVLAAEGRVRKMAEEGLADFLEALGARQEARIAGGGKAWTPASVPQDYWDKLIRGIVGFELEVLAWRPTLKLSQNKSAEDREAVAAGLEANGAAALAQLMRGLAP